MRQVQLLPMVEGVFILALLPREVSAKAKGTPH